MQSAKFSAKKYIHVTIKDSTDVSTRANLRAESLVESKRSLAKQFCGRGPNGSNVWPANMPRRVRRSIERDAAKNRFRKLRAEGR